MKDGNLIVFLLQSVCHIYQKGSNGHGVSRNSQTGTFLLRGAGMQMGLFSQFSPKKVLNVEVSDLFQLLQQPGVSTDR